MAGIYWTDDKLKAEILAVVDDGYMPSSQDLTRLNRSDIASRITKRGGYAHWAVECGLRRKDSDSRTGLLAEDYVSAELRRRGFLVERQTSRCRYDLIVNRRITVDVKAGSMWKDVGYIFGIGHKDVDYLLLVPLLTGQTYGPIHVVPGAECRQQTVTLTASHRFNSYKERFDLLTNTDKPLLPPEAKPVKIPYLTQRDRDDLRRAIISVLTASPRPLDRKEIHAGLMQIGCLQFENKTITADGLPLEHMRQVGLIRMLGKKKRVAYELMPS